MMAIAYSLGSLCCMVLLIVYLSFSSCAILIFFVGPKRSIKKETHLLSS